MTDSSVPEMRTEGALDIDEINLDFSPETIPVIEQTTLLPNDVYHLFLESVEVVPTKSEEPMLVLWWAVDEGRFTGAKIRDTILIPGAARRQQDPKKYKQLMGFTRNKLEAITGKEWREENMRLRPKEMSGCTVWASVIQAPYSYNKDGQQKSGIGNEVMRYFGPSETPVPPPPTPTAPTMPVAGTAPTEAPQQGVPGSFKL